MNINNNQILNELTEKQNNNFKWLIISSVNLISSLFYGLLMAFVIWGIKGYKAENWDPTRNEGEYLSLMVFAFVVTFLVTFTLFFVTLVFFFIRHLIINYKMSKLEREREREIANQVWKINSWKNEIFFPAFFPN